MIWQYCFFIVLEYFIFPILSIFLILFLKKTVFKEKMIDVKDFINALVLEMEVILCMAFGLYGISNFAHNNPFNMHTFFMGICGVFLTFFFLSILFFSYIKKMNTQVESINIGLLRTKYFGINSNKTNVSWMIIILAIYIFVGAYTHYLIDKNIIEEKISVTILIMTFLFIVVISFYFLNKAVLNILQTNQNSKFSYFNAVETDSNNSKLDLLNNIARLKLVLVSTKRENPIYISSLQQLSDYYTQIQDYNKALYYINETVLYYEDENLNEELFNAVMARMEKIELLSELALTDAKYQEQLTWEIAEIKRRYSNLGFQVVDNL